MKKTGVITFLILLVITIFVFERFSMVEEEENRKQVHKNFSNEVRAVYVSYIELSKYLDKPTIEEQREGVAKIVQVAKENGFNWIILHTRSFSDSIYPSKVFPSNYLITRNEKEAISLDVLAEFIQVAHENDIQVHAWINPYRIRNEESFQSITESNPCLKWIGTNHIKKIEGKGIFYNPASREVEDLIIAGIREILLNYDVDGIHLDDYFYPDKTIDLENYQEYVGGGGELSIEKYRLDVVNHLVARIYSTVKEINPKVVVGIAPDANVQNDYQEHFADILTWVRNSGYVDYIMPQIYYGFQNETKPFTQTVNDWNSYIENENISLLPALALYKSGNVDEYAKTGRNEWVEHSNVITRQIQVSRNMSHYMGFSIFRFDNFVDVQTENTKQEVLNFRNLFLENSIIQ